MKTFGKVESRFWFSPDIQSLSDQAKLLALYLLTTGHGNMLGVFRMPRGYIMSDLGWDKKTVDRTVSELLANNFLTVSEQSDYICINHFVQHNDTENAAQFKARITLLESLPDNVPDISHVIQALLDKASKHKGCSDQAKRIRTVSERFGKCSHRE